MVDEMEDFIVNWGWGILGYIGGILGGLGRINCPGNEDEL